LNLIKRVREQSEKVVVILISGRPLMITEALPYADAFVAAWLPGTEGMGVADVLFGDRPFTGKLPFTWPRSAEQLPFDFANLPADGCDAPLFPYGFGIDPALSEPVICRFARNESCLSKVENYFSFAFQRNKKFLEEVLS
jgi:hypothetical protein